MDILKRDPESFHWDCSLLRVPRPYLSLHVLCSFPCHLHSHTVLCESTMLVKCQPLGFVKYRLEKTYVCTWRVTGWWVDVGRETGKITVQYNVGVLRACSELPCFFLSPFLDMFELLELKFLSLVQASPLCSSYWLGVSTGISSRHYKFDMSQWKSWIFSPPSECHC